MRKKNPIRSLALSLLLAAGCAAPGYDWGFDPDAEEGVHGGVPVEWWYHWGFLTDETGGEWAWFSSFFRAHGQGLAARYLLHDLLDMKSGKSDYRSLLGSEVLTAWQLSSGKKSPEPPHGLIPGGMREKAGGPLDLKYGDAALIRTGHRTWRLEAGGVDLQLRATAPPMAVEGTGLTGLDKPDDMHYYTFPRLEAVGTVRGRKAKGLLWYDHQWGGSWVQQTVGWSWWGVQFDDGSNLNAVVIRDTKTGKVLKATATHDERVYALTARPTAHWTSPLGVRYPTAWELSAGPLRLRVEPYFPDREHPVLFGLEAIWEGPVRVTGSHAGRGFQELVGYPKDARVTD
ncbi:MAG TPA: lipocalin family protein [Planctomycetota bacterium]|nr:lipocalin family protein [Planctomycetota bacterium]